MVIRTPNLLIRSQMLYPVELRARRPDASEKGPGEEGRTLMKLPRACKTGPVPQFGPDFRSRFPFSGAANGR